MPAANRLIDVGHENQQADPHEQELCDVGPDDGEQTTQRNVGDKNDGSQQQADHEFETEQAFENESHAAQLCDQVNDARDSNDKGAPGAEPATVETVAHVVRDCKAARLPQLFREQVKDDCGTADERDVWKDCDATECAGIGDAAEYRAAVHDRRHIRHNQHAEPESPAGYPEVRFGFLIARGNQAKCDDCYQVQAEDNGADGACSQENYPYSLP